MIKIKRCSSETFGSKVALIKLCVSKTAMIQSEIMSITYVSHAVVFIWITGIIFSINIIEIEQICHCISFQLAFNSTTTNRLYLAEHSF